jgi:type I site-specific restriction endonuclease
LPNPTEAKTRNDLINPALEKADWNLADPNQVGFEIPVDETDPQVWQRLQTKLRTLRERGVPYNVALPSGISDYALYRPNGEIIAIVEAKRSSVDARLAQTQAEFYITEIARRQSFQPFAFLSNGLTHHFWDGETARREVEGFFSLADLERLLYLKQQRKPLSGQPIKLEITDRLYQQQAIRQINEAFEAGKRRALVVMATGTGKTRTAMSLVDVFLQADQARNILFVADRDALVEQAFWNGCVIHI